MQESLPPSRQRTRAPLLPLLLVCGLFLGVGIVWLDDFGATYDEFETYTATEQCWDFLTGQRGIPDYHVIRGYYFVVDMARALFVEPFSSRPNPVAAHHAFNLVLSTCSLALLYLLVFEISGRWRVATFSAVALGLMPPFISHSQNNPKDLPVLFAFLATFWLLRRAVTREGSTHAVLAALALGASLTSGPFCVFLAPIFVVWLAGRWPRLAARRWPLLAGVFAGGAACGFLAWPWLWDHPLGKLRFLASRLDAERQADYILLYLGDVYRWSDLPWHYVPLHLLVSMPIPLLLLAACSAAAIGSWPHRAEGLTDVVWTGTVWVATLLAAEQLSPVRYDGLRHLLVVLPGVAMLVGTGAEWLTAALARIAGKLVAAVPLALAALWISVEIAVVHPYEVAYLNPVANAAFGPSTEAWLELDYWGAVYREGAEWLEGIAEPDARIYVPLGDFQVAHYLGRPVLAEGSFSEFEDASRTSYLVIHSRIVWFGESVRRIQATYEPVHTIRRQRATLLEIYSNRGHRRDPPLPMREDSRRALR